MSELSREQVEARLLKALSEWDGEEHAIAALAPTVAAMLDERDRLARAEVVRDVEAVVDTLQGVGVHRLRQALNRHMPSGTAGAPDLLEEGRRLASKRDDLIASGVDPADLANPIAPSDAAGGPQEPRGASERVGGPSESARPADGCTEPHACHPKPWGNVGEWWTCGCGRQWWLRRNDGRGNVVWETGV